MLCDSSPNNVKKCAPKYYFLYPYLFTFKYLDGSDEATSFYNFEIVLFQIALKHFFFSFFKISDQIQVTK